MSTQNTSTPWALVRAIELFFGVQIKFDLAASPENTKATRFFTEEDDALSLDWPTDCHSFLNPQFKYLTRWINKCVEQKIAGAKFFTIWPLSSDANQIPAYQRAKVYMVHGRVWPLVRSCMICKWDLRDHFTGVAGGLQWDGKILTKIW